MDQVVLSSNFSGSGPSSNLQGRRRRSEDERLQFALSEREQSWENNMDKEMATDAVPVWAVVGDARQKQRRENECGAS